MGVERLACLPRKVCAFFAVAVVVHMFVLFAGHRKECVTEMVRVESTDSPLSAMAGVKAPPQGTGVC